METKPALWVLKHKLKTETGVPIEFEKRKFLWDMYNDLSPNQVRLKPPQIGLTVEGVVKSFYVAKNPANLPELGRDIIYTLPTQTDVEDMAGGKINRIVAQNPVLQEWVRDHDTVSQKTVGNHIIYYRGTFTQKQAMMVSSGLNIHDEVDASDAEVINQYETRLQAQEDGGWRWYFSHPSLSGHGVDVYWQQSDQKEWFVKCDGGHEQTLIWPQSIDRERGEYNCTTCNRVLTTRNRINGVWRNRDGIEWTGTIAGGYEFSGWHVSQLMLYNKTARDIILAYEDPMKDRQYFYNYVLGLPYIGSDDKIDPKVVLKNVTASVNDTYGSRVIIGVDSGHGLHYVCMNKDGVFYYDNAKEITATKDPYDELRRLLDKWDKSIVVADQGGDLIGIRKLQQEYKGRVFLVFYRKDRKTQDTVQWSDGEHYGEVVVDRNRMIQIIVEQMREPGRFRLNGTPEEWTEFASHFGNIYREKIVVKDSREKDNSTLYGNQYVWKRNGPDHYVHALLYALVGHDKFAEQYAKVVQNDGMEGIKSARIVSDSGIILGATGWNG